MSQERYAVNPTLLPKFESDDNYWGKCKLYIDLQRIESFKDKDKQQIYQELQAYRLSKLYHIDK
jgi:hypothetical protein